MREFLLKFPVAARLCLLLMIFSLPFRIVGQTETINPAPNLQAYANAGLANPTVTSDRDDYAPGETAIITGTGWTLDSTVDIHLEEEPAHEHHHGYHGTVVDAAGNWKIEYPIEERHLGVKFTVVVDGAQSKYQGLAFFTDALNTILYGTAAEGARGGAVILSARLVQQQSGQGGSSGVGNGNGVPGMTLQFELNGHEVGNATTDAYGNAILNTVIPSAINVGIYNNGVSVRYSKPQQGEYNSSSGTAALTVLPACNIPIISIEPLNSTITYGTNSTFSVTASGNVDSYQWESKSVTPGTTWIPIESATSASYVVTNPTVAMSGYQYRVVVSGCNSSVTSNAASLIVNQKAASVVVADMSKEYGSDDPVFTGTLEGFLAADVVTASYNRVTGENVLDGPYVISASLSPAAILGNYDITYTSGSFDIDKKAITITAEPQSKTYGDADPALTAKVTSGSIVVGDAATGSLVRSAGEDVGSYSISKASYTYGSNYDETFVGANLVIGQRAITITADAQSKTYGDADSALTAKVTSGSIVGQDAATGSLVRSAGEDVGSYSISKASYTYGSNYDETFVSANLVIGQRAITITADAQSKIYGDADPALTAKVTSGSIVGQDAVTGSLVRSAGEDVGSYSISKASYTFGSNYDETFVGANLVIGQRAITITADAQSKTYGDADSALTAKVTSGSIVGQDAATGSLVRSAGEDVGSYSISKASYTYGSNYDETFVGANLLIGQRAITITADPQSKTYGDADPALTAKVTSGSIVGQDAVTGSLVRSAGEDVGSYSISKASYTFGSNYDETFVGANLVIGQRAITITADAHSKTYGNADPALTATVTSGSIVVGDAATGSLVRSAGEDVGSYSISKASYTYGSNYDETFVGANLVIGQRAITITADPQSKTYGDADPALTVKVTSGSIVVGDAATGSLVRSAGEDVGSYSISKASYTYGSNYDETFVGANLVIGQRAITITADAQSKTYGDADPALTAKVTSGSIVGQDAATGSLVRSAGEDVGSYSISKASYTYGSNYDETFVGASLVIGQRAVTITADSQSKTYGDADPSLTAKVTSGSIIGQDAATGSLVRSAGEDVGSYSISKASYTYGSNYDETFVGANLVIGQRAITITADAQSKTYGDSDPALTARVTSGSIVGQDAVTGSLARSAGENVGSYSISKASFTYGSNYDETFVGANLVIGQRAITITADPQSKTYGDEDPALTAKVTSGSIVGEDAATGSLARSAGENVGSYSISKASYTYGSNYDETFVGANLVIGQRAITITADAQSKFCGQEETLTYKITNGNLVSSDALNGSLTRVSGESIGSYDILLGTVALSNNYSLSYVPAQLMIKGVTLDVTNAQSPRSIIEDVIITIKVTDGANNLSGVLVKVSVGASTKEAFSVNGVATINFSKLASGLYPVTAQAGGCTVTETVFLPIYDPNGGFVTGGGWIESPANAMESAIVGRANFGFNAKYKTGKNNTTEVDGNTNFQFKAGDLHFSSSLHDDMSLVISGAKATYTGTGVVNGVGTHKFRLIAVDGEITGGGGYDKFRIMIWKDGSSSDLLYDNKRGVSESSDDATVLGGGSIVIHKPKSAQKAQQEAALVQAFEPVVEILTTMSIAPNPVSTEALVRFTFNADASAMVEIFDFSNRKVANLFNGKVTANQVNELTFNRDGLPGGSYFVKVTASNGQTFTKQIIID